MFADNIIGPYSDNGLYGIFLIYYFQEAFFLFTQFHR
jgi:hypothetical protein